jgi:hypothetical protein
MRGFAIAGFVFGAAVIAAACSSSSPSEFPDDSSDANIDQVFGCLCLSDVDATPTCSFVLPTGKNDAPTGACGAKGSSCTTTGPGPCGELSSAPWTCTCETSWECVSSQAGAGSCDAGTPVDAASDLDASDAADGDAS